MLCKDQHVDVYLTEKVFVISPIRGSTWVGHVLAAAGSILRSRSRRSLVLFPVLSERPTQTLLSLGFTGSRCSSGVRYSFLLVEYGRPPVLRSKILRDVVCS